MASERMINVGRLVHGIEYHPNIRVNALLSILSEFTLFSVDDLMFSPKSHHSACYLETVKKLNDLRS